MTKISREEALKIARMSALHIHDDEIDPLIEQLEAVLSYAERVREGARDVADPSNKNINVFREDVAVKTDPAPIMAQAPEEQAHYFVVPAILERT